MEYIKFENATKFDLMKVFTEFTSSGKLVDDVFNFIVKNKSILEDDEYVNIIEEPVKIRPGIYNSMMLNAKYSINIKKSLIILIMILLDSKLKNAIASTGSALAGLSGQTIYKITNRERCILLDTLISNKRIVNDYLYFEKECVQNDIECPYRSDYMCNRNEFDIEKVLDELMSKQIIVRKNGIIRISF